MTDIAGLLRRAAEYVGPCGDSELVGEMLAAAEKMVEPVAWISDELVNGKCVGVMAYRERNSEDQVPLYPAPPPAVPEGWELTAKTWGIELRSPENCVAQYRRYSSDPDETIAREFLQALLAAAKEQGRE